MLPFAIILSQYNAQIGRKLLKGAIAELKKVKIKYKIFEVPGAFELPLIAKKLAVSGNYQAIICLGAIIRGETSHFEYIARETAHGIAKASYDTEIPIIFGVLTTENLKQAEKRAIKTANKGTEAAYAAIKMARLITTLDK